MLRVEEARALILKNAPARRIVHRTPLEAVGLVIAADVVAPEPLPPFPCSGMDGYAVRTADTRSATTAEPVVLRPVGVIPAGHPMAEPLAPGATAAIMTGGAVPAGADAVIRLEEVRVTDSGIALHRPVAPGENVAPVGEDVARGQTVLRPGHPVRPAEVHLLSALGMSTVPVYAPPRVGILCTGDELVPAGQRPRHGQIRDANGPGIAALVRSAGCIPVDLGLAHDVADVIAGAIGHVRECDLILTTGGVSVGDFDVVREALTVTGARELFRRVSMKPGMPVCASVLEDRLVISLSGTPSAAITNFDLLVRPLLDLLCGRARLGLRAVEAVLDQPVLKMLPLSRYLRARIYTGDHGDLHVDSDMAQRTGVLSSMVHANAYAVIPGHAGPLSAGARVTVLLQNDADVAVSGHIVVL